MLLLMAQALMFPSFAIISVEGESPKTAWDWLFTIGIFILFIAIAYFMYFKIRVIRYDNEKVEVINGSDVYQTEWGNVENVSKVFGCAPPLYRMTFKDGAQAAYFVMSMFFYAYAVFWSWDFTGFYKFARSKINYEQDT